jgi:hypothetical protein
MSQIARSAIPFLEVGVYPTEGKSLMTALAWFLEGIVGKLAIVAVIVVDANAVLGSKLLKRLLGGDSLDGGIINLVMHETQSGVMVHKNGATPVPLLGEFPFQLGKKSPPWLIPFG